MTLHYLFAFDLETCGLNPTDPILEIGARILESEFPFDELVRYNAVVQPPPGALQDLPPVVQEMHTENGLLEAIGNGEGVSIEKVQADLVNIIERLPHFEEDKKVIPFGSGVCHFDIDTALEQMPRVAARFHYAPLDVGVVRRMVELSGAVNLISNGKTFGEGLGTPHRAPDDIDDHIFELRRYSTMLRAYSVLVSQIVQDGPFTRSPRRYEH